MAFYFLLLFCFLMFLQPGIVFPEFSDYSPYKYSMIIAVVFFILSNNKSKVPFLSIKNAKYFVLFVFWQVISTSTLSFNMGLDIFLNTWLNLFVIYILILKQCTDEKKIQAIMFMIIAAICYLSYDSIIKFTINYGTSENLASGYGVYENRNDLVYILTVVIPLAICLVELSGSLIKRYLFISVASLFTLNILLAGSRNGLLGLLTVGVLSLLSSKKISGIFRMMLLGCLAISIIAVGVATVLSRSDLGGGLSGDNSSEDRILQWKACLRMTKAHPIFGVGHGQSQFEMRDYGGIPGLVPHNTLIQAFAETGIPGGIFFVFFSVYPLWEGWNFLKLNKNEKKDKYIILYHYLIISLSGFWVCAIFSNRLYLRYIYVVIALITATRENILKKRGLIADD